MTIHDEVTPAAGEAIDATIQALDTVWDRWGNRPTVEVPADVLEQLAELSTLSERAG